MDCPTCGKPLKEGAKFCIYCGTKVAQDLPAATTAVKPEEESDHLKEQQIGDLAQTANRRIYWDIQQGQVARVIKSQDLTQFKDVRGVIISEGTTAYVRVNGKTVLTLNGGTYDFKQAKSDKDDAPLKRAWNIVRGLFGKKELTEAEEKSLLKHIQEGSSFTIIILVDKAFPLLIGAKQTTLDDYKTFRPMSLKTKYLTVQVGVNAYFQIADKEHFIQHWLIDRTELTTTQIVDELSDTVRAYLQSCMEDAEWEGNTVPDDLRRKLKEELNTDAVNKYFGLTIARIVEISAESKDLERFRQLSSEMYLSEQEMDYLRRTNDFKNRLAEVQNAQQLHEARTSVELQRELDKINKDDLLRQDELDKFKLLLESERRLREARTQEEEEAAMAEIRRTGLMREIDYKRIEHDADLERRRKEADFAFEQQQREEDAKAQRRQQQFEQFMAMENAANQHELEMARTKNETEREWSERLYQQQQAQNDQMMSLLQTMAGARTPQTQMTSPAPAAPAPSMKYCNQCGAHIQTDSKHCPECGAKQN